MIIGVDFDNTIVCYDALFHRVAVERGLVPASIAATKNSVRDFLRAAGREPEWTALQGHVYGPRMAEADPFPGVRDFFRACREQGIAVCIVSHKTRHPFIGEPYDLHAAAQDWLKRQGFLSPDGAGLRPEQIFFELTKLAKLARIATCECTHFIDDLPEILNDPTFPANTARLLFAPTATAPSVPMHSNRSLCVAAGLRACRSAIPELGQAGTPAATWKERTTDVVYGASTFANWSDLQNQLLDFAQALAEIQDGALQPAALSRLLKLFSGESPHSLEPLTGGANNRVHRARTVSGHDYIVKQYFTPASDTRDRYRSEHSFYTFAWETARVRCIPEPLAWNETDRLGAFALIEGTRLEQATADDVTAALDFFAQLNAARTRTRVDALRPAAETCHTLTEHLATVQSRMDRLTGISGTDPIDAAARSFVSDTLFPAWQDALHHPALLAALSDKHADSAPLPRCVSPSDFGFHNTLRRADGSLVFFDFEYAGWDDPAKLVCDFFCQPAVPAPIDCYDNFVDRVAAALGCASSEVLAARCRLLLPIYQLKWCTIMLNEFLPAGNRRRRFAGTADIVARKTTQLAKAAAALHPPLVLAC